YGAHAVPLQIVQQAAGAADGHTQDLRARSQLVVQEWMHRVCAFGAQELKHAAAMAASADDDQRDGLAHGMQSPKCCNGQCWTPSRRSTFTAVSQRMRTSSNRLRRSRYSASSATF